MRTEKRRDTRLQQVEERLTSPTLSRAERNTLVSERDSLIQLQGDLDSIHSFYPSDIEEEARAFQTPWWLTD